MRSMIPNVSVGPDASRNRIRPNYRLLSNCSMTRMPFTPGRPRRHVRLGDRVPCSPRRHEAGPFALVRGPCPSPRQPCARPATVPRHPPLRTTPRGSQVTVYSRSARPTDGHVGNAPSTRLHGTVGRGEHRAPRPRTPQSSWRCTLRPPPEPAGFTVTSAQAPSRILRTRCRARKPPRALRTRRATHLLAHGESLPHRLRRV